MTATRGLRTVALIKQVPLGGGTGALGSDGRLRRDGLDTEMNPWCRRAVTQAVHLGGDGGQSTAVTMGPPGAADVLREAMACGVDEAVHVCDPALAGADCLVTAKVLASAVEELGPVDLVLVGRSSVDGSTSAVGIMVAELLGLPFAGPVLSIDRGRRDGVPVLRTSVQAEEGVRPAEVRLPAVVAVAERSCQPAKAPVGSWPRGARIRRRALPDLMGAKRLASPTQVIAVSGAVPARRPVLITGDAARAVDLWEAREHGNARAARGRPVVPSRRRAVRAGVVLALAGRPDTARPLLGEAAVLAGRVGARVVGVVPAGQDGVPAGQDVEQHERLAAWGADELLVLGDGAPRPVAAALRDWVEGDGMPWAVLGSGRAWDREVLGRLAVRLDSGLMSDLIGVHAGGGDAGSARLVGAKPSGSAGIAEIVSHGPTQIATLRTGCLDLRVPRAVSAPPAVRRLAVGREPSVRLGPGTSDDAYDDLERAGVVIGVGRGVDPVHHEELLRLCASLGAGLAATRKVTDAGWLPHSRQVGITARDIAPSLYIALGISGNMNHLMGVRRAGTVLAVNNDRDAPIFAHCDIGIVADWRDVMPRLATELHRRGHTGEPATDDALV